MRIVVYALIGIAAIATVISLIGPDVDLALASLFYDPVTRKFAAFNHPYLTPLRQQGWIAAATCIGLFALALTRFLPWRLPSIPHRNAIALTLSLLIGPGLLVNGILKTYGGRPRPSQVTQFNGDLRFVDWWDPNGACPGNCSFMSGEVSTAAWMFGPAMLVPPPWRAAAIAAAAAYTLFIAVMRMAVGGHFFADVLFGALFTILIILAVNRWVAGRSGADSGLHA